MWVSIDFKSASHLYQKVRVEATPLGGWEARISSRNLEPITPVFKGQGRLSTRSTIYNLPFTMPSATIHPKNTFKQKIFFQMFSFLIGIEYICDAVKF